jgi:tryptophan halogenase
MTDNALKRIVIVGGGTAGWMCAAILGHFLPKGRFEIALVESEQIGTIGVGESTVPPILELLRNLGINEQDFIQATQGSFKLGIRFDDWRKKGEQYFHPFGNIGGPVRAVNGTALDFYQLWLRAKQTGHPSGLQDFAPAAVMAHAGKFMLPQKARNTPIGSAAMSLHIDASLAAKFLRTHAEANGVTRHEGIVGQIHQHDTGFIRSVELKDGREIAGDFFLDCTGFRALLIGQTLKTGFIDWSDELLCDRAVAVQTENINPPHPYTYAQAQSSGWRWRIPLQHRAGNGYVFSSKHISDDDAVASLMAQVEGEAVTKPMIIPFKTGMRAELWSKNCVSVGLASGFIEPLESTAIHLIYRAMDFLLRYFPQRDCDPTLIREYNRRMATDYTEIKDFVVLHYCTTERDDTPFWRDVRNAPVPQTLREKLELFRLNGTLREGVDELFRAPSWQSVMEGMGIRPRAYLPQADQISQSDLEATLAAVSKQLPAFVDTLPSHGEFLKHHCPAHLPKAAVA